MNYLGGLFMNEKKAKETMHDFLAVWEKGEIDNALAFFTVESVWENTQGTFTGIAQIEKYLKWVREANKDFKVTEHKAGIIVQGDTAVIEHELSGVINGEKWSQPAICVWEFKDDKISELRTYGDSLVIAQQVAKGPVEKLAVSSIVKAFHAGLE
jgi:ketosteroid isomerase-like protein